MKTAPAVLLLALFATTPLHAATITYDVSGTSDFSPVGEVRRKAFAPEGQAPFFITPFAPGSTLTIEFDSNGDGTRGDVTIVASELRVRAAFPEFREGLSITTDIVGELTGGVGRIIDYGDDYPWDEWISWSAPASYSVTGTWECFGPWCAANGFATGEPLPYEELLALHAATVVPSISLGSWQLYSGGGQDYFASVCQYDEPPACHVFASLETEVGADPWSTGMWLRGRAVPESPAAWLVAGALIILAWLRTKGSSAKYLPTAAGLIVAALCTAPSSSRADSITYDARGVPDDIRGSTQLVFSKKAPDPFDAWYTPFAPGSTLTLEFDANGDGESGDVTIAESRFLIRGVLASPDDDFAITTNFVGALTGGLGRELDFSSTYGHRISWTEPASYSVTGTWQCIGSGCLGLGAGEGDALPYGAFLAAFGGTAIDEISLGSWYLNLFDRSSFGSFCQSSGGFECHVVEPIPTARLSIDPERLVVGMWLTGYAVPEPSAAWLVAVALVALALRRRTSGTIRRHEAC